MYGDGAALSPSPPQYPVDFTGGYSYFVAAFCLAFTPRRQLYSSGGSPVTPELFLIRSLAGLINIFFNNFFFKFKYIRPKNTYFDYWLISPTNVINS